MDNSKFVELTFRPWISVSTDVLVSIVLFRFVQASLQAMVFREELPDQNFQVQASRSRSRSRPQVQALGPGPGSRSRLQIRTARL